MRAASLIVAVLAAAGSITAAPVCEIGTFVEFVPKSQRDGSQFGYGLVVFVLQQADDPDNMFITHSAGELIWHFRQLPPWVQEHGIWVTLAEKDSYSLDEKTVFRALKLQCLQYDIPMFIRTGMQSEAWRQVSPKFAIPW